MWMDSPVDRGNQENQDLPVTRRKWVVIKILIFVCVKNYLYLFKWLNCPVFKDQMKRWITETSFQKNFLTARPVSTLKDNKNLPFTEATPKLVAVSCQISYIKS